MNLADWQDYLAEHYGTLRAERSATNPNVPLFALEHGLSPEEVADISTQLKDHIRKWGLSGQHSLPWIVYATELGYRYSGYEYWQTFEAETPGWSGNDYRYWLRDCFFSFQRRFSGAHPKGLWANHFSIICWPITHAILPRDLQRHLAEVLYDLRHRYSADLFESPSTLGEAIAIRSWGAPSRFQEFAQETELTGQIAAALLFQGDRGTQAFLLPSTRKRISADLDQERRSREWLVGARKAANERATFRGALPGRPPGTTVPSDLVREQVAALAVEPRVVLRPALSDPRGWDVMLELPNLSPLLERFPAERATLAESRCAVRGAVGSPLARGRVLDSSQRVLLARWPAADEVLLEFERQSPDLNAVLRTDCLLRPGPTWLFRVASDGIAYEMRGMRVRGGERYVVLTTESQPALLRFAQPCACSCNGVSAFAFSLPDAIPAQLESSIRDAGLAAARVVRVWPAGLAAASWDGEGHAEWLVGEEPTVALTSDHDLASASTSLNFDRIDLGPLRAGTTIFLSLPKLQVGLHRLRITTQPMGTGRGTEVGDLDIAIREPRRSFAGAALQGPVQVNVEPRYPSLEHVWQNQVSLEIEGPAGRRVVCTVNLRTSRTTRPLVSRSIPGLRLPVSAQQWCEAFGRHFKDVQDVQRHFDAAGVAEIDFRFDEFGRLRLCCQRLVTPVRWAVRRHDHRYEIQLLDDSGQRTVPSCTRFSFERPDVAEAVSDLASGRPGWVHPEGGLYCATCGAFQAAVLVSAAQLQHGLGALRCNAQPSAALNTAELVSQFLQVVEWWSAATPTGDGFSSLRRPLVLRALSSYLSTAFCGSRWTRVEVASSSEEFWQEAERVLKRDPLEWRSAQILEIHRKELVEKPCVRRVDHLASLMYSQFKTLTPGNCPAVDPRNVRWISELALRLASQPQSVRSWAGPQLLPGLRRLAQLPALQRLARFLALMVDRSLPPRPAGSVEALAGWRWE
ncbi:MAG: hypothetical protein AB2L07_15680 [Thermoanaerobaculaceae bacterium]